MTNDAQKRVVDNMNLVYQFLKVNYPKFMRDDDLIQAGMVGLVKAANTFDESIGVKFSTYAYKCIKSCVWQEWKKGQKAYDAGVDLFSLDSITDGLDFITGIDNECDKLSTDLEYKILVEDMFKWCNDEIEKKILTGYLLDKPQKEIADELGISSDSVCRIVKRIRARFKRRLAAKYGDWSTL